MNCNPVLLHSRRKHTSAFVSAKFGGSCAKLNPTGTSWFVQMRASLIMSGIPHELSAWSDCSGGIVDMEATGCRRTSRSHNSSSLLQAERVNNSFSSSSPDDAKAKRDVRAMFQRCATNAKTKHRRNCLHANIAWTTVYTLVFIAAIECNVPSIKNLQLRNCTVPYLRLCYRSESILRRHSIVTWCLWRLSSPHYLECTPAVKPGHSSFLEVHVAAMSAERDAGPHKSRLKSIQFVFYESVVVLSAFKLLHTLFYLSQAFSRHGHYAGAPHGFCLAWFV